jgi:acyl-CoA hydrolase
VIAIGDRPETVPRPLALGAQSMYEAIDGHPDMMCRTVDYTNPAHMIMQNDKVFSIKNTTQMDLQGRAASESDGHRLISGTGSQLQVRAAPMRRREARFSCASLRYLKRSVSERARAMISLAHPDFRETLEREAWENRLIPRAPCLAQSGQRERI